MKGSQSGMEYKFNNLSQYVVFFFFSGIFRFESDLERTKEKHRGKHERAQIKFIRKQCLYPKPVLF